MNTKTICYWLTKYLQMHYLQARMGYLKSASPNWAERERESGVKKCWYFNRGCLNHGQRLWTPLQGQSPEAFIPSHRWRHSYGWPLTVNKSWRGTSHCESQTGGEETSAWSSTSMRSLQPFNHPGQVPVACLFSILPFWAVINKLGSLFVNLRCQVVFYMSHISNLVLHHCKKQNKNVKLVTTSVNLPRIQT